MSGSVRVHDRGPAREELLREVVEGLRASPKQLPCKLFYDENGSKLFEEICTLEEYYPTRTEIAILNEHLPEMAELLGPACEIVEYGSGAGDKTLLLLDALDSPVAYVPIDISMDALLESAERLRVRYPEIPVIPVCADYTSRVELPKTDRPAGRIAVFFPGSTIGNFDPPEAEAFLHRMARLVGAGGDLLIGVDLVKDREVLERAYDDSAGVTAAFNLNVLQRLNRELDADFRLDRFRHHAFFNERAGRIEMHLVSVEEQTVTIEDRVFPFRTGESIWTESSYKYELDGFATLARAAGFEVQKVWTDPKRWFSVQLLTVPA